MKPEVLRVEGLAGRHFGEVDFLLRSGEGRVVVSASMVVLNALADAVFGLEAPEKGRSFLLGESLHGIRERLLLEKLRAVGHATADGGLISNLKVWENLLLPLQARGDGVMPAIEELEASVVEAFSVAGVEEEKVVGMMALTPDRLSAFERIVAALVRCHLAGFELLVCDRLFDGIDHARIERVRALVDWMGKARPESALLVLCHSSQDPGEAFGLSAWKPIDKMRLEHESWPDS